MEHIRLAGTALLLDCLAWPQGAAAQAANTAGGRNKLGHLQRKQAYSVGLEKLRTQVPGDVEIDSFTRCR